MFCCNCYTHLRCIVSWEDIVSSVNSNDKPSKRRAIQRVALNIVRREMRLYDALSATPRLRYERAVVHALDAIADAQHGTRSCAHDRALIDTCTECERTDEDCKAYRVAATQRIKDLLKQLGE
jgi:hypothetical protein